MRKVSIVSRDPINIASIAVAILSLEDAKIVKGILEKSENVLGVVIEEI